MRTPPAHAMRPAPNLALTWRDWLTLAAIVAIAAAPWVAGAVWWLS